MLLKINNKAPEYYVQLNYNKSIPNTESTTFVIENTTEVTIIGYGRTSQDGPISDTLLQVNFYVVNYTFYQTYYKINYQIIVANNKKVTCAGTYFNCW